ncbi:phenylacetate--CoA ligase family protein [Yersinia rochesterensis]|nr:phenylacetate--CoA ligase family protein [Yersinia rochesterensis]
MNLSIGRMNEEKNLIMTKSNTNQTNATTMHLTDTLNQKIILSPEQLVTFARNHSPFYAQLYRDVPMTGWQLQDLPLIDPVQYWKNSCALEDWPVLTGPVRGAQVFKTGGTAGGSKLSVYTQDEWRAFITTFGRGVSSQLQSGDRVANLFFAGDLYASFLFIHGVLSHMNTPVCEYPFTGASAADPEALTEQINRHKINALVGIPAHLLHYITELDMQGILLPGVTTILYGGESLFAEQLQLFRRVLPNARIASIGCASVDAGLIGASTPDCHLGEHRCFEPETIVEIINEATKEPICDTHSSGMLVITNLTRTLMPMIRYPVGDIAAWVEPQGSKNRKFILQGRSSFGHRLRVGYASLFPDEINTLISEQLGNCYWQLLIEQFGGCDNLTICIAFPGNSDNSEVLIRHLQKRDASITSLMQHGQLVVSVQWCRQTDLKLHPRTGKLQRVIDCRNYQAQVGSSE